MFFFLVQGVRMLHASDPCLPSKEAALGALPGVGFAAKPIQIPATVIDAGILQNVPYLSYRVGSDREVNVYGDPEAPACIEIGLYRSLLGAEEEKRRCVAFLRKLVPEVDFNSVKLTTGKTIRGSMVVEVTMPDAPDAYGGWWISAYRLDLLHKAAGTSANVSVVSVSTEESIKTGEWSASDLTQSRGYSSGSSGRVYVHSYYRKDGTYVQSHTRSR